ncbi:MAG: pyridoxal 5'-phosphate synthase glutaminase subunit PdxT [Thermoleophilia bacterium]|nr:pyridoxal 5'-phosphate synthase glutaminase subunit PdxT [Thermoleophilia bacterium]
MRAPGAATLTAGGERPKAPGESVPRATSRPGGRRGAPRLPLRAPARTGRRRSPSLKSASVAATLKIGVLAVQGNFREHAAMLRRLGADVVEVRLPEQLEGLDGLVIPGGESTAIGRLIRLYGLEDAIRRFPGAVLGTCAGMILLDRAHLDLVDLEVARNAYGRQVASFEADLDLGGEDDPLRGVFIRAPRVASAGPSLEVLAEHDGVPVLLRDGRFLVASFHPELTDDTRVHERFLELVREAKREEAYVGT